MYSKSIPLFLFVSTALFQCVLLSQPPRGPLVITPQVNADKMVTFRYQEPSAKEVKLSVQSEKAPYRTSKWYAVKEVSTEFYNK